MQLLIKGRPASKKNSRRNYGHISLPSKAYERFHEDALWQLKKYKQRFTGLIRIDYIFRQKGRLSQDFDNAIGSINDVLQDAEIIANDKNIRMGTFEVKTGCLDWETVVVIEQIA